MPAIVRLNKQGLIDLIDKTEAAGGDATALRRELEALEPEVSRTPRRGSRNEEREETTEERLDRRLGDFFPDGIPYQEIIDYDRRFSQKEIVEQCRKAGLSIGRDKKELAANLILHNSTSTEGAKKQSEADAKDVRIVRDETEYDEEPGHPALPEGVRYPVQYKEMKAVIDGIGHVSYIYYPSVRVGHIEFVDVEPAHRRRGFGSRLLQFAIDDMKKKGIVKVSASILSKEGVTLLKAHGFSFANHLMEKRI